MTLVGRYDHFGFLVSHGNIFSPLCLKTLHSARFRKTNHTQPERNTRFSESIVLFLNNS